MTTRRSNCGNIFQFCRPSDPLLEKHLRKQSVFFNQLFFASRCAFFFDQFCRFSAVRAADEDNWT